MTARRRIPDVLLERYLAGDLSADLRRHIEREREAHPDTRTRLEELRADRQAFLAADLPADVARRLAGRLEITDAVAAPARPRRWLTWVLGPSAAAVATVVVVTVITVTHSADETAPVVTTPGTGAVESDDAPEAGPAGAHESPEARPAGAQEPPKAGPAGDRGAPAPGGERAVDELAPEVEPSVAPGPPNAERPRRSGRRPRAKSRKRKVERPDLSKSAVESAAPGAAEQAPPAPKARAPKPAAAPAPSVEAEVDLGAADDAPTTGGSRRGVSRRTILDAFRSQTSGLSRCLKPSQETPSGEYTLMLAWTVRADGSVEQPRIESPRSIRKTALGRCVVEEMRSWVFPAPERPTPFRIPFEVTVE